MTLWDEAKERAQDVVERVLDLVDADQHRTEEEQTLVDITRAMCAYVIAATEYAYAGARMGRGGKIDKHIQARLNEADALVASVQGVASEKKSRLYLVETEAA